MIRQVQMNITSAPRLNISFTCRGAFLPGQPPHEIMPMISISSPANVLKDPVLFLIAAKAGCAWTGSHSDLTSDQADLRHNHLIHRLRIIRYTIPIIAVANIPAKPGVPSSGVASVAAGVGVMSAPIIRSILSCGMNEPPSPSI